MSEKIDFLILGAGIVGLSLARELNKRHPTASIIILEKEPALGMHASGRNSGVLHSGVFYGEDSVKAKVCAQGARELGEFCDLHKLPIRRCGKVIVPTRAGEDERIEILAERAKHNGARAEIIGESQLSKIEPEAKSISGRALHLPDVAIIEPVSILNQMSKNLRAQGVRLLMNQRVLEINPKISLVRTREASFSFGHFFNCAGLFADKIAHLFGIGKRYAILPFKGGYYEVSPTSGIRINGLIYAVPDPLVPFLGVHFTKKIDGHAYAGPSVVPALGRENYHGLSGMNVAESGVIFSRLVALYAVNHQNFRTFAHREAPRLLKSRFASAAAAMVPKLRPEDLIPSEKVGIRAQLVDLEEKKLVMDFLVEYGENSTHILNAVSPAFTSAFPFVRLVLNY